VGEVALQLTCNVGLFVLKEMAELLAILVKNTKSVMLVYFGLTIDEKDVLVPSEAYRLGCRMPIAVL